MACAIFAPSSHRSVVRLKLGGCDGASASKLYPHPHRPTPPGAGEKYWLSESAASKPLSAEPDGYQWLARLTDCRNEMNSM